MSEHLDVQYLALVPADAQEVMSDESDDLQWFDRRLRCPIRSIRACAHSSTTRGRDRTGAQAAGRGVGKVNGR